MIAAHLGPALPGVGGRGSLSFPRAARRRYRDSGATKPATCWSRCERETARAAASARVVNLTVDAAMPEESARSAARNLEIDAADVWEIDGPLGLGDLSELTDLDRPDLKDPPLVAARARRSCARGQDHLRRAAPAATCCCTIPTTRSAPVVEFIAGGGARPQVLAIKQTLYRVGSRTRRWSQALLDAARARQAGGGAGGAEGALRRREQHRVGAAAGARRASTSSTA